MNQDSSPSFSMSSWIALTYAGWIAGIIILLSGSALLEWTHYQGQAVIGLGMGLGIGIFQWLYLKKRSDIGISWAWYNIAGLLSTYLFFDAFDRYFKLTPEIYTILATALGGLLAGWLQYRFILKKRYPLSGHWVLYCFIGWTLAHLFNISFFTLKLDLPKYIIIPLAFIMITIGGPVLGWITGLSMKKILIKLQ